MSIAVMIWSFNLMFSSSVKDTAAGEDEEEGTSSQPPSKRLKVEPEKKKEKRHKVDEDEIQKMQ